MKIRNHLNTIYCAVYKNLNFFEGGFGNQTDSAHALRHVPAQVLRRQEVGELEAE